MTALDDSALVGGGAGTGRSSIQQAGPLSRWRCWTAAILGTRGAEPEGTLCFCDVTDGQTDGPPSAAGPARSPAGSGCKKGAQGHVPSRLGPVSRGRLSSLHPPCSSPFPHTSRPWSRFHIRKPKTGRKLRKQSESPIKWKVFPSVLSQGNVEVGGPVGG